MKKRSVTSLRDFIDKEVGKRETKKRDKFESEYEAFKLGVLIQQARQEKGLTQDRLPICRAQTSRTFQNSKRT